MKNLFFYIAIYCLFSMSLVAQQNNSLRGKILFLNSDKKPADGVWISGSIKDTIHANSVYSASDGSYHLKFTKAKVGAPVNLNVGDTDRSGQRLELVNEREVRKFRIPAIATDEFEIIICKKGARDTIAQRYYRIIKSSSDKEIIKVKKRIDSLLAQQEKDYDTIRMLSEKIAGMQQRSDSVTLYREAFRLASINKDNASKRVLDYLKLLDEGKSVQEAREALSIEGAANELEESNSEFRAAVKELETRAEVSVSISDYKDAVQCYLSVINYMEKMGIDRLEKAGYYLKIAYMYFNDSDYENALDYQQKAIEVYEKVLGSRHPELATAYSDIADTYHALVRYEDALTYHQKALAIREKVLEARHPGLATSYNNIASACHALEWYETALTYHQKTIKIRKKKSGRKHPNLAAAYSNMAATYSAIGKYRKALKYQQRVVKIYKNAFPDNHPDQKKALDKLSEIIENLEVSAKSNQK